MSDTPQVPVVVEHAPPATHLHPLVQMMQAAVSQGGPPDVALLREMMQLQRDWEAGEAKRAFTRALVALKQDLPTIIRRDATVDYSGSKGRVYYTHASLAGVMAAITEPLTRHGFSLGFTVATGSNTITVTARLTHADGHSEETTLTAPPDTSGGKGAAQGIASTITLLQRYAALAILGIATADMKEPGDEAPAADAIDPERNLRAIGKLATHGRTREQAEEFLGRDVSRWTVADLQRLASWVKRPEESE